MVFLKELVELITVPPGDLVYHLVTVFAIQLILGMAFGHWNRHRNDPTSIRLLVTGLGFAIGRTLLMLVAVLDRVGVLSPNIVLPPLERFLDFVILVLAVWTFLPILERRPRLGIVLFVPVLLMATGVYAAFATLWPQAEAQGIIYSGYWQEIVWDISAILVLLLAVVAGVIWREGDWGLAICLFALWLAGYGLQFTAPFVDSHTAGWVRLANLAALPLVAGLTYRRVLGASPIGDRDNVVRMVNVLDLVRQIEAAGDVESVLKLAASTVKHTLGADTVAIGLPASGSGKGVRVVALHPPTGVMLTEKEPTLLASKYPLLASAFQTGHMQRARVPRQDPTIAALYRSLGFDRPGPLLVQPLVNGSALHGVLLAGNPVSQKRWTMRDEQILQAVGAAIAASMAKSNRRESSGRGAELRKIHAEARRLARRVADLEAELEQKHQLAEELATTLRLREQQASDKNQAETEATIWQDEIRNLAEARTALEAELADWKEKTEQLTCVRDGLQTELTQTQAELEEALQQVSSALTARSSDGEWGGILVSDGQGNIVLASQGAQYLTGQSESALLGKPFQTLFDGALFDQAVSNLLQEDSQAGSVVVRTFDLGGRTIRAELTRLSNTADWSGTMAITLYPEAGSTVQSRIAVSLIHELSTPMNSITGYTDLLLGESVGILGEMQRQFMQRIKANVERMEGLLNDLVKVTAIDAGQISLMPEPVDIINIIEDAIMALSAQFSERELAVQMDMPSELPRVRADRDGLYQIVQHLLSNACQCSRPGSEIQVTARLEEYDDQVEELPDYLFVSVADTGGGIATEDQHRVFQRLYRADNPLIAGLGDTGVGLSIAKSLVEAQGGRIWVESEMGVGSTFSFILPLSSEAGSDRWSGGTSTDAGGQE